MLGLNTNSPEASAALRNKNDIEFTEKPDSLQTPPQFNVRLVARKVKGQRGVEYHLRVQRVGSRNVSYALLRGRKRIKELRDELGEERQTLVVVKSSAANKLIAALGVGVLDGVKRRRVNGRLRLAICGYCHTPLLRGFILAGHKLTRRKEFCSDACKMKDNRRRNANAN